MCVTVQKIPLKKHGSLLFELDNKAFNRKIDFKFKDLTELLDFFKKSVIYLVYNDKTPVGYFAYQENGKKETEVRTVAVIPSHQRKGIGTLMMKKLLWLTKNHRLKIVTHPQNVGAIFLYLRFGFKIYGWSDNYWGDGQPRLLLELENKTGARTK